ncbi:unnamed protein product [Moneuplotes crassus]|uniref:Uncharacterized protein n=1 Tax=Euplotes crassus TaxID=5936 RepID=A0AAD1U0M8_EUPCR|nr:unnamed protein product [Moneuplotes crassus]
MEILKMPRMQQKGIEIKRDLIQELILYQIATEEESKCEISEEFKLKFIETIREIDLNQHLKEKLTHSNEQTVSGKTVLAPAKRSSASVEDSKNYSERNSHENPINNKYPRNEEIEHANRRSPSDLKIGTMDQDIQEKEQEGIDIMIVHIMFRINLLKIHLDSHIGIHLRCDQDNIIPPAIIQSLDKTLEKCCSEDIKECEDQNVEINESTLLGYLFQ